MDFELSERAREHQERLLAFVARHELRRRREGGCA